MAKKANGETKDSGSNSAETRTLIKSAADRILRLQDEIATLRSDITEIKGEVKGAGILMADFNAALRLYKMEEADDRNESIDNIRLCFEALGLGSQGDLFPDAGEASAEHNLH